MKQISFPRVEFERKKRLTKRAAFLAELGELILWPALLAVVLPPYPEGTRGLANPLIAKRRLLALDAQAAS